MNQTKPTVERDANGVPTSWLLVRAGPVPLRKNGADYVLELTSKDLSAIEAYQKSQGERIPIDSNHYLHILAQRHGIEEWRISSPDCLRDVRFPAMALDKHNERKYSIAGKYTIPARTRNTP